MTTTTNLAITLIDTNQSQKEVTANEAIVALEAALTEVVDVEVEDGANVVSAAAMREAFCVRLVAGSPAPSAAVDVELPAVKRPIIVRNECGQSADVNVDGDLATVTVANGATALLYCDGTTVTNVAGGSSSGATVFTGLTDAPSSYTGQGGKRVAVNSGATALEFVESEQQFGISEQTDDYTLVLGDAHTFVLMNKATAVTLTVPEEASVDFALGTQIYVMQLGAGQVTLQEGATGVEILTRSSLATLDQYSVVHLIKIGDDLWSVDGSLEGSYEAGPIQTIPIACSDETTALTTGTGKVTFRMPFAFTLTGVRASVTTAPTGSALTVDINEGGSSILSTEITIDATEKTSTTAATPAVISDTALADDAEITIDIDTVGSTVAGAGLKVYLLGRPA